jgi:hypothetical protein
MPAKKKPGALPERMRKAVQDKPARRPARKRIPHQPAATPAAMSDGTSSTHPALPRGWRLEAAEREREREKARRARKRRKP